MIPALTAVSAGHLSTYHVPHHALRAARPIESSPLSAAKLHEILRQALFTCNRKKGTFLVALLAMDVSRLFIRLGFSTITCYATARLGLSPLQTLTYLSIARARDDLPLCYEACRSGSLSWRQLSCIARVATQDTEATWLDYAGKHTPEELESEVRDTVNRTAESPFQIYAAAASPGVMPPSGILA